MSTKLSGDMMWEKSSTRRFAPPGGQSSISLGSYQPSSGQQATPVTKGVVSDVVVTPTPTKPRVKTSAAVVSSATAKPTSTTFQVAASGGGLQVGVVVSDAEGLKAATVAALCKLGAKPVVYEVADPLQLPFAAQCMVEKKGVAAVVVIGFLVAESHWCCKEVAGSLVKTLLELSLQLKVPLINGLNFSHVMAGDVNSIGEGLARGAVDMAAVREGSKETYTVSRAYPSVDSSPSESTERSLDMKPDQKPSVFRQSRSVPNDLESLLLGLKTALKAHGAKGIFGLARRFRISDRDKSGSIDFHEFQVCMRDMHMDWTEDELKNVFEHFDADGSKAINYEEFLFAVRGQVNERRAQLILEAFDVLDKDKSGIINSADLQGVYDTSKHPDVIAGKCTEADVLEQFISTFEGEIKDGKVTPEEWCRYYAMLSASINTDDEFELMMRNAWHLPGGKGPLTNTSAKRVLVTRADGSQTVEVVNGALAATGMDKKGILRSLRSRGLAVTGVDFFGKLETTEPATTSMKAKDASPGRVKAESPTYAPPVRQRPGGNSSLVLG